MIIDKFKNAKDVVDVIEVLDDASTALSRST